MDRLIEGGGGGGGGGGHHSGQLGPIPWPCTVSCTVYDKIIITQ